MQTTGPDIFSFHAVRRGKLMLEISTRSSVRITNGLSNQHFVSQYEAGKREHIYNINAYTVQS